MSSRIRLVSKIVLGIFAACALSTVAAWGVLLTGLCSNPRVRTPETGHVIPYNCHGMTVFITPLDDTLKTWLLPLFMVFGLLAMIAAAFVLLAHAQVRVDVRIDRGAPKAD